MEWRFSCTNPPVKRLVQERCYSSALAMELHLFCMNPSQYGLTGEPKVKHIIIYDGKEFINLLNIIISMLLNSKTHAHRPKARDKNSKRKIKRSTLFSYSRQHMMTSRHGNGFPITGPMWGEPTSDSPHKGLVMKSFIFACQPGQAVEETVKLWVILNALTLMWHHCNVKFHILHICISLNLIFILHIWQEAWWPNKLPCKWIYTLIYT